MDVKKHRGKIYILLYLIGIILIFLIVLWSLNKLTINTTSSSEISYVEE